MASLNFNKVILGGRLTADPELKTTPSGISVTSFSVAVDRRTSKDGVERKTDFINCNAWRNTAEFITRYFHKGSCILVEGVLQQRSWEDNEGRRRTVYEVQVDNAYFVDSKSESGNGEYRSSSPSPSDYIPDAYNVNPANAPKFEELSDDEPLPF